MVGALGHSGKADAGLDAINASPPWPLHIERLRLGGFQAGGQLRILFAQIVAVEAFSSASFCCSNVFDALAEVGIAGLAVQTYELSSALAFSSLSMRSDNCRSSSAGSAGLCRNAGLPATQAKRATMPRSGA